ncbi:MAG TPA: hypothetical protein VGB47_01840 [Thermoanaerobaculia bacterium]
MTKAEKIAAEGLLDQAAALEIPWDRILEDEIRAERALRLSLADVNEDWPIWPAFWILPLSLFDSWRVRDRIQVLAWKASRERCGASARQLRALHAHLLGRENCRATDATLMAKHLWFGYQRVLALARTSRAAEKLRGDLRERIDALRESTGCSIADARWALERAESARRGHRLDDAMRRVRDEGFELPEDPEEIRAFRRLRSFVRSSPHLARLQNG